jgi:hypothetical protein
VIFLLEIVDGWALSEPCTRENMGVLVDNYPGAVKAIMATYYQELTGNREKLIAVASAFYTPEPSADELSAFGLTAEDYDDVVINVWPDIWPAFVSFARPARSGAPVRRGYRSGLQCPRAAHEGL